MLYLSNFGRNKPDSEGGTDTYKQLELNSDAD